MDKLASLYIGLWALVFSCATLAQQQNPERRENPEHQETEAPQDVLVGVYEFAPFAFTDEDHNPVGVSYDLMAAFNQLQNRYRFAPLKTSPSSRYQSFERNQFDMLMFENKHWGWQQQPISASRVYLKGGEVYVALREQRRNQEFFDSFAGKSIIGIRGYHYGFADFNNDPKHLKQRFNMLLTHSNKSSIRMLLGRRGDIAVITQSYLKLYLKDHPDAAQRLLVSNKMDQEYQHTLLIRDDHPLTPEILNQWLDRLESEGLLQQIWQKWGLQ